MASHTDINTAGLVARLPPAWRAYVLLARLDRPAGAWLLFLPGLWSILLARRPDLFSAWLIGLFCAGSFVMRGAGCAVNDMWDRDLDRQVTRTAGRPLAAGMLRMRHAFAFLAALSAVGLVILLQLPALAQGLGVASLLLVAVYPLAKRISWWPQVMLGLTFGWGALMGWAAAGPWRPVALCLYGAAMLWILGYDTIYAHQDREDDALVGIKSTARLFARTSRPFLAVCYAGTVALLGWAGFLAGLSVWFFLLLALPAAGLAWQVVRLEVDDPAACLALFRLNIKVGFAVALAILAGWFL